MGRTVYVTTEIEVDISEFSEKDLLDEIEARGLDAPADVSDLISGLWQALYLGRDDRAMEIAREIAEKATGRLVPVKVAA